MSLYVYCNCRQPLGALCERRNIGELAGRVDPATLNADAVHTGNARFGDIGRIGTAPRYAHAECRQSVFAKISFILSYRSSLRFTSGMDGR